ncbi:MAG: TetR/AcrR family transcriptional regulator [Pseudomonadota bacterium]
MGSSQKQKAEHHQLLLEIAARTVREGGLQSLGIAKLMEAAGLTHGGFYSHFQSRDELIGETLNQAFDQARVDLFGAINRRREGDFLSDFIKVYLNEHHRDHPELGCVVATLSSDVQRSDEATRDLYTERFRTYIGEIQELMSDGVKERETRAISLLCLMAGAIIVARTVTDDALSKKVLKAASKLANKAAAE